MIDNERLREEIENLLYAIKNHAAYCGTSTIGVSNSLLSPSLCTDVADEIIKLIDKCKKESK